MPRARSISNVASRTVVMGAQSTGPCAPVACGPGGPQGPQAATAPRDASGAGCGQRAGDLARAAARGLGVRPPPRRRHPRERRPDRPHAVRAAGVLPERRGRRARRDRPPHRCAGAVLRRGRRGRRDRVQLRGARRPGGVAGAVHRGQRRGDGPAAATSTTRVPGCRRCRRWSRRRRSTHLLAAHGVPEEPDVFSVDVDGSDYWIWRALERHRPRVVVVEYNASSRPAGASSSRATRARGTGRTSTARRSTRSSPSARRRATGSCTAT